MCNRTPPSPSLQRLPHGTLLQPQSCPTCPHFPQLDRVGANYTAAAWQQLCRTVVQKSRCPKRESLSVAMLQLWMQRQLSVVRVFVASKALHSHLMCVCVCICFFPACNKCQRPHCCCIRHCRYEPWPLFGANVLISVATPKCVPGTQSMQSGSQQGFICVDIHYTASMQHFCFAIVCFTR